VMVGFEAIVYFCAAAEPAFWVCDARGSARHHGIELCRNGLAHFDRSIQRVGQGRIFNRGNALPAGDFLDLRGQQIAPFSDHNGRVHFHAVFESDGELRGIGDYDRRALHVLQHAAAPGLALQAANALLDRGMSFHFLELILLVLAAHLQFVFMALPLQEIVGTGPHQKHQ